MYFSCRMKQHVFAILVTNKVFSENASTKAYLQITALRKVFSLFCFLFDLFQMIIFAGWVRFPLRNFTNIQTDKWQTAFYGTKLCVIRAILDRGQPLTQGKY